MIVLIDNYDSFTYNLVQYLGEVHSLGREIRVVRNDSVSVPEICALQPTHIVISPGPCTPNEAGISCDLIAACSARIPILGVCLGHQAIAQVFGGRVIRASRPMHGKTSRISHTGVGIFAGLPREFHATRYHSLVVERETLPAELEVLAWAEDGEIMAFRHSVHPWVIGLQFHPESILTEHGKVLLARFLEIQSAVITSRFESCRDADDPNKFS